VFVIAATGLLNGKRATTHWRYTGELARIYPEFTFNRMCSTSMKATS
jgi:AraC family transcriptional activator FtrA